MKLNNKQHIHTTLCRVVTRSLAGRETDLVWWAHTRVGRCGRRTGATCGRSPSLAREGAASGGSAAEPPVGRVNEKKYNNNASG
jgi:hypothetical protein